MPNGCLPSSYVEIRRTFMSLCGMPIDCEVNAVVTITMIRGDANPLGNAESPVILGTGELKPGLAVCSLWTIAGSDDPGREQLASQPRRTVRQRSWQLRAGPARQHAG